MRLFVFGLFFFLLSLAAMGQCPNPGFIVPTTSVCIGSPLTFVDTTSGSNLVYSWDFSAGDLSYAPTDDTVGMLPYLTYSDGFTIAEDGGNYYGFATDFLGHRIVQCNFNGNLDSEPLMTTLNLGGPLTNVIGFDVIKVAGQWYGFATVWGNQLYRINFGSSLSNTNPGAPTPITTVGLNNPNSIVIREDGGNFYGFVANYGGASVTRISFGNSILNPTPICDQLLGSTNGLVSPWYLTIKKFCSTWVGLITDYSSNEITQITFIGNLSTSVTVSPFDPLSGGLYAGIDLIEENCNYYAFVSSENNDNLYKLSYGYNLNSTPTATLVVDSHGYNSRPRGLHCISSISRYWVFVMQNGANKPLVRWKFPDTSSVNIFTSNLYSPSSIIYNSAGIYNVSLSVLDTITGSSSSFCQIVHVYPDAPIADFVIPDKCSSLPVLFHDTTLNSPNNSIWSWDFGDATTDANRNAGHIYAADGTYHVTHTIEVNGCSSSVTKTVVFCNKPLPDFTVSNSCFGNQTQFNNTSNCYDAMTFQWDFGDSQISNTISPTHLYAALGTYNVKLIVTSDSGCVDSLIIPVTISIPSASTISFAPAMVCAGSPILFTDNSINAPNAYLWRTAAAVSTSSSPTFIFPAAGTDTVFLVATTGTSCLDSTYITFTVNPGPSVHFVSDSVCWGATTRLIDASTTSVGTLDTFKWVFQDSMGIAMGDTTYHTFLACGTNTIYHYVTTSTGCVGTDTAIVTVYCPPNAGFSFMASACTSNPIHFTDTSHFVSGNSIQHWNWNFNDSSAVDTNRNTTHSFANAGYYEVYLTVTNNLGCVSALDSAIINIYQGPIPRFSISNTNICLGDTIHFTDYSIGNISHWLWNFNDPASGPNNLDTNTNSSHLYLNTGSYIPVLTVVQKINATLTCAASDTATFSPIYVHPVPLASFTDSAFCAGYPVFFKSTSTVAPNVFNDSITWCTWTSGSINNFGDTTRIIFPNAGNDTIKLLAQTFYCSADTSQIITINPSPTANFTFSPNYGLAPLAVIFTNNSTGTGLQNVWNFGDGSALANTYNAFHLFQNNACDTIILTATNSFSCSDKYSKILCLKETILDIAVENLQASITGNLLNVNARIANKGTRTITNFIVEANLGGSSIAMPFNDTLVADISGQDTLHFQQYFVINPNAIPDFLCLKATLPNGVSPDANPANDELCLNLSQQLMVLDVFPNPTLDKTMLDVIVPINSEIVVTAYDVIGQRVAVLYDGVTTIGLNEIPLYTQNLAKGCYLLAIDFRDARVVKKFNKF